MVLTAKKYHARLLKLPQTTILIQILGTCFVCLLRFSVNCLDTYDQFYAQNEIELSDRAIRGSHMQARLNEIDDQRNKCAHAEQDLDRCSAQLIAFGHNEAVYPGSMEALNSVYCPHFKKLVSCVKNSTECYKPFEKQIINWVLTSTRRMNYKRCRNEDEKVKFLRLTSSCFSLASDQSRNNLTILKYSQMKSPMDRCMVDYIGSLESIADSDRFGERLQTDDIQIQLSCCANRRFKECVMNKAKKSCKPVDSLKKLKRTNSVSSQRVAQRQIQKSMQDMMEDLKSTLDGMALTGPELICQSVSEKFCQTNFDGRHYGRVARYKSIVPAMIKIYSNK